MNLDQITAVAYNAVAQEAIATRDTVNAVDRNEPLPKMFEDLADSDWQKTDALTRAKNHLDNPITYARLAEWSISKVRDGSVQVGAATFEAVCIALRSEYVPS